MIGLSGPHSHLNGETIFSDAFNYADGPLGDQGNWSRMPNTLDPPILPVVSSGAVQFDLTTNTTDNYGVRHLWPSSDEVSGWIYAIFDFTMLERAEDNDLIPFLTFGDASGSTGNQRGAIGFRRGCEPGTLRLGWQQSAQRVYHLERSDDPGGGWQTIQTFATEASEEIFNFSDSDMLTVPRRFYRLRLESD